MSLIYIISPERVEALSRTPHPPVSFASSGERDSFRKQVQLALNKLEATLCSMGYSSNRGMSVDARYDFYINDDVGDYRFLSFVIFSRRMLVPALLLKLDQFLRSLAEQYVIFISNEFEDSDELFMVALSEGVAWGNFESKDIALKLGFSVEGAASFKRIQ